MYDLINSSKAGEMLVTFARSFPWETQVIVPTQCLIDGWIEALPRVIDLNVKPLEILYVFSISIVV